MGIAPVMLDLDGLEITNEEKELLNHPLVGGVIFFSRNYESVEQLSRLVADVRQATKGKSLLICVDHEGGRVQRFRTEFTTLPAIATLAVSTNPEEKSYSHGWLMAAEVRAMDIDFSFAPVLDVNFGVSEVIGDRSFNRNPKTISILATEYIKGMREAGMASTGKHFPGHGAVTEDSHHEIPVDTRSREEIWQEDIIPFADLIKQGLDAVMPAHVIYKEIDDKPAGFSPYWLQTVLRDELNFDGVILLMT
jgi:beta-N-acetylhexosaminidase